MEFGKKIKFGLMLFVVLTAFQYANGQFYYSGRGSSDLKWMQIKAKNYKVLYPDYYESTAIKVAGYLDSIVPYVRYGMKRKYIQLPLILETQNQLSNGMVVWAPKRAELVVTPPINSYAQPWMKQLVTHEYRHVSQLSNLKGGLTKIATWVLGEAGIGIGLLVISDRVLEGDATNAETQLAEYGRGLQPQFTIGYRALMGDGYFSRMTFDQLVCGSNNMYIPDVYQYGYQLVRATETYTRPDIWGDIYKYCGQYPIFLFPDAVYLKHHYKTSVGMVMQRAFRDMQLLWKPYSEIENNYATITKPNRRYTTYRYPTPINNSVVVLKSDFDREQYLISIDSTGKERKIKPLTNVSSRLAVKGDDVYWTEYRSDLIYEKKNYSVICRVDLQGKKRQSFWTKESNYLLTPTKDGFATVQYDSLTNGFVQLFDKEFNKVGKINFDDMTSLHGLAWDEATESLGFIALDDRGMWLGAIKNGEVEVLREPSAVSLNDLSASDGKLYFTSIESGKDEIHSVGILDRVEVRLTDSKYGAINPYANDYNLYMATYSSKGWMLGRQKIDSLRNDTVSWSRLPQDKLNVDWVKWQIDRSRADSVKMVDSTTRHFVKRFNKATHLLNLNSWAPVATDINGLLNETDIKMGFGATGFMQSVLGDFYGSVSVGTLWGKSMGRFWGMADLVYAGLPVQIGVKAEYGAGDQMVYGWQGANETSLDARFSIQGQLFAPLRFNDGTNFRTLTPRFGVTHYNAKLYDVGSDNYSIGYQQWSASVAWSNLRASSKNSIMSRLGYSVMVGASGAFRDDFAIQWTLYAKGYLPGFMLNHSWSLAASYQEQDGGSYKFSGKTLGVRGVVNNYAAKQYMAGTFDYKFPLCYPDGGIPAVLYLNRITMGLFADYSFGKYYTTPPVLSNLSYCSAGFDIGIDYTLVRSYKGSFNFTFAFPKNLPMYFGVSFDFQF